MPVNIPPMQRVPGDAERQALRDYAPTPEELEKYPSLKHAWDEYMIIRKLIVPPPEPKPRMMTPKEILDRLFR